MRLKVLKRAKHLDRHSQAFPGKLALPPKLLLLLLLLPLSF